MGNVLADAWAKFHWAQMHAQAMKSEISIWTTRQGNRPPFRREFKFNPAQGRMVWRVTEVPDLPVGWALIAGDMLTNYRAALDYVAWQLVKAGTSPNPRHEHLVQFPIHDTEAGFDKRLGQRLPGVDDQSRAYVEYYQPYRQRPNDPAADPLALLAELSNRDKDRQLQLAFAGNVHYNAVVESADGFIVDRIELPQGVGVVQPGAVMAYVYGNPLPNEEPKVNLSLYGTVSIAFEGGQWVPETIDAIAARVHAIVSTFELIL